MSKRGVVITDGNERAALAVVRSLGQRGVPVYVGAESAQSLAGASKYCAGTFAYPSPWLDPDGYMTSLQQAIVKWDVAALFPMTDIAMELIGARRGEFEELVALPIPSLEAYHSLSDKYQLTSWAEANGIPVPPTYYVRDGVIDAALAEIDRWPVIVKPGRSLIARGERWAKSAVMVAQNADDLRKVYHDHWFLKEPSMIQHFIEGQGEGVFGLFAEGEPKALFAHRRLRERPPSGGVSVFREAIALPQKMTSHAVRIMQAANWTGIAMVEFKVDPTSQTPYLMEVNGRFWGSLQLAVDAGVDFPWLLYQQACGQLPAIGQAPYAIGVRSRWWLGDLDHLLTRLRKPRAAISLPPGSASRLQTFVSLTNVFDRRTRGEVLRLSDPGPGAVELARFVRSSAAGIGRKVSRLVRAGGNRVSRTVSDTNLRLGFHRSTLDGSFPAHAANILVLCKGNVCRSPFVERWLQDEAKRRGLTLQVSSAGFDAIEGREAYPMAKDVAPAFSVDLIEHRARQISEAMIDEADLVLVMEPGQLKEVSKLFPTAAAKTFLLGHFAMDRPTSTIHDPYGGEAAQFDRCFKILRDASEGFMSHLADIDP